MSEHQSTLDVILGAPGSWGERKTTDWRQPYLDHIHICALLGWYAEMERTKHKLAQMEAEHGGR